MTSNNCENGYHSVRKINFGPGPAQLPLEVLQNIQAQFLDYNGSGSNVMELSHRSATFSKIINDAERDIREILSIPDSYAVLFLQGGGTGQFSAIPLNFLDLKSSQTADYLVTGYWSEKAAKEAEKFGKINWVVPKSDKYQDVPSQDKWKLNKDASYFYYCANETIHGIELSDIPDIIPKDVPIVCDMSSNFLTRPVDVTKFGIIFASAQKNFGASGVVLVIIRKDLVGKSNNKSVPVNFDYKIQIDNNSMYNTPPTFSVYVSNMMFDWIKRQGGMKFFDQETAKKSALVYKIIDESNGFYINPINPKYRSRVNIPFRVGINGVPNEKLEASFLAEAIKANMIELKGHRAVGGLRASLYNGITIEETAKLVELMRSFQKNNS